MGVVEGLVETGCATSQERAGRRVRVTSATAEKITSHGRQLGRRESTVQAGRTGLVGHRPEQRVRVAVLDEEGVAGGLMAVAAVQLEGGDPRRPLRVVDQCP